MTTTTRKTPIKYKRGKTPTVRHGDLIDLTTWPLHSKPLGRSPIETCPKCGRKGERSTYESGDQNYTHLTRFDTIFWMVKDSCYVKAGS